MVGLLGVADVAVAAFVPAELCPDLLVAAGRLTQAELLARDLGHRRLLWLPALCPTADRRSSSLPAGGEVFLHERGVLLACGGLASQGRHPVLTVEAVLDQDSGCGGTRPAPAGTHLV